MTENKQEHIDLSPPFRETEGFASTLSLIVAASSNNVIGANNQLPWHLPNDLKYFKNLTWGMPIIMGRKTFESIGKPLPGRQSIVITRNQEWQPTGIDVVHSLTDAATKGSTYGAKELFVIGGAEIFNQALPVAGKLYLTRIHHSFDGDVFFPPVDETQWHLSSERFCAADEKNAYNHTYQVWEKKA